MFHVKQLRVLGLEDLADDVCHDRGRLVNGPTKDDLGEGIRVDRANVDHLGGVIRLGLVGGS